MRLAWVQRVEPVGGVLAREFAHPCRAGAAGGGDNVELAGSSSGSDDHGVAVQVVINGQGLSAGYRVHLALCYTSGAHKG